MLPDWEPQPAGVGTAVQLWRDKLYPHVTLGATCVATGMILVWKRDPSDLINVLFNIVFDCSNPFHLLDQL